MRRAIVLVVLVACGSDAGPPPVRGRLTREDGTAVAGARIALAGRTATTAADGSFSLDGVAAGSYLAEVGIAGEPAHAAPVAVRGGGAAVVVPAAPRAGVARLWLGGDVMFARRFFDPNGDGDSATPSSIPTTRRRARRGRWRRSRPSSATPTCRSSTSRPR